MTPLIQSKGAFTALRGFLRKQQAERCELCGLKLTGDHAHLFEHAEGGLLCACEACAILFYHRPGEGKYSRVPRTARRLTNFRITDAEWSALMLPIDMAFFQDCTRVGRIMAYYPSPAGCTESLLDLSAWQDIMRNNAGLAELVPDVETLLVNRTRDRRDYYIAPIDQCYRLAGLIRLHWQGLSGGEIVWAKIGEFFESLDRQACLT